MSVRPVATWHISLDAECPSCEESVDLLDLPDFWDCRHLDIGENQTDRTRGFEAECPACRHEWLVDLVY